MANVDESIIMTKDEREQVEMLSQMVVKQLHLITKLNFHREELFSRNTIAYTCIHPFISFKNSLDLYFFQKNCTHFLGLYSELQ